MIRIGMLFFLVLTTTTFAITPALMVENGGKSTPLGLTDLKVETRIFGGVAETTTTVVFRNRLPRVMEGDLYFPLPEGATISGYALDINGTMADGVAVEKHEARKVFEEVVRKGVDPGLVEWTRGNNFKTRVFPIPANGSRTVRVQYLAELSGKKEDLLYQLPLNFKEKLEKFSLRIEVVKPAGAPKIGQGGMKGLFFKGHQGSFVAETKLEKVLLAEDLAVLIPDSRKQPVMVEVADDGEVYFSISDMVSPTATASAISPKHIVLYWDSSGSRGNGDHKREIGILKTYFKKSAAKNVNVDLIEVRNTTSKVKRFVISQGDASLLAKELENVQYDGGTQLAVITPDPKATKPDFYLLFSDGLSNFGKEQPGDLNAPLYVFSSDASANHSFLQSLALTSGGRYFNLTKVSDSEGVQGIGRAAYSFLSATSTDKAAAITPEIPTAVDGRFLVVGKLGADEATVTLNYGVKGGATNPHVFKVSRTTSVKGSTLKRLWAQKKLADLMIFPKRNEKEIITLGKQHGLVTPYTSLLVLDTVDQYVQYEIAPPKSLPGIRDEYLRRIDTIEHQKQKQKADKIAEVVKMWDERVKWWQANYKYPKNFQFGSPAKGEAGGAINDGISASGALAKRGESQGASRPQEAPAPPRSAPVAEQAPTGGSADEFSMESAVSNSVAYKAKEKKQATSGSHTPQPGIAIKAWIPNTPYLKELKAASVPNRFAVYLKNRKEFGASPAFYLECADLFRAEKNSELALQVLSNISELQIEDASLLRVLGYRLLQLNYVDLAVQTFEQVLEMRPEEPQSYRDLALTLARRAAATENKDSARADYTRAIDLLVQIVLKPWDSRFAEIELIALEEVNDIIPKAKAVGVTSIPLDSRLIKLLDVDVRIVMTWQADNTDMDLWVTEPSGEKAYYGHNRTTIGGLVSHDFTGGYGPEEYMVHKAMTGMYKVETNYFGSRASQLIGAVIVQVDVFTHFGRKNEQHKSLTISLKGAKDTVLIGEIEF